MLSPNMKNTLGYWRILEEEEGSLNLDRIDLRETELENDKLELDICKRTQRKEKDRTFEEDSCIETNNEFWKEAGILIENENITRNKIIETS